MISSGAPFSREADKSRWGLPFHILLLVLILSLLLLLRLLLLLVVFLIFSASYFVSFPVINVPIDPSLLSTEAGVYSDTAHLRCPLARAQSYSEIPD